MKTVKHPKWDKQNPDKRIMFDPDGSSNKTSLNEPFKVNQRIISSINGNEITMQITNLLNDNKFEAKIIRIIDGSDDVEEMNDLLLDDFVLIKEDEIKRRDIE